MRELRVEIPGQAYSVFVGEGLLERAHELIPKPPRAEVVALVTDGNVAAMHGERARSGLAGLELRVEEFAVEPGEASKSPDAAEALWRWLTGAGAHRGDLVVALGGGVVTDLAGFAAATFHRGIPWVAAPTTLLAQVDAAIGGKTGLDLPEGKNLVGAFHQPLAVIADVSALATLPDDDFTTGLAEVIKHGLIADSDLLARLRTERGRVLARDAHALVTLVADAAWVKVRIVAEDPTEQDVRTHLNYGHTLAHALETLGEYARWTHGKAVSVGMMFAAHLAAGLGYADRVAEHRAVIEALGLPTSGAGAEYEDVRMLWTRDKKYERGVRFVLLEDLGKPIVVAGAPEEAVRRAYEAVR